MRRNNNPTAKIELESNQSEYSPRSENNKNDHPRDERKKKKRKNPHTEGFDQDIVESSEPSIILQKKSRSNNRDSEMSNAALMKRNEADSEKAVKNKSRVSQILLSSDEDEERHSSKTKRVRKFISSSTSNKTSDNHRSEGLESDKELSQDSEQDFEFVGAMKSAKFPADTTSSCGSPNISVEHVKTEPDLIGKHRKHKERKKVEEKKANTLLAMIHDNSSNSDSDNETKKIDDCSVETLNKEGTKEHNKSKISKMLATSSDEDEGRHSSKIKRVRKFISSATSNKTLDNHRTEGRDGDEEFSQDSEQDFEFVGVMKSAKLPADTAFDRGSPNILVERVKTEPDLIGKHTKHNAKEKVEKKKANTHLAMIHDNSSKSDSDNETQKIDDCSVETLDKEGTKEHNKSKTSKMLATSSDEDEERYSSKTTHVRQFIPNPKSDKTLDSHRSESRENDRDRSQDNWQGFKFVDLMGSEELPANIASNCDSSNITVEDIKIEPDVIGKDRKRKAKEKVEKKKANTLLAMIHDRGSSSDLDDEVKKIDDSSEKSVDKVKSRKIIKSRVSETFHGVKGNEPSSEQSVRDPSEDSAEHRKFDLEAEARDVEEMINAIEEAEQVPEESVARLLKLRVTLRHTVPPQHQIETCAGSRGPSPKQKEMIEKFGPIKYGKFTPEEDNIIVDNWKSFCKLHNWDSRDVQPFLYMRHQNVGSVTKFSERHKFVQFLADGLPWRTLYSVYWRFRTLYRPHIQTRYTEDEDKLIIAHMENSLAIDEKNVRKFSELAKILNRTRASVWKRYRLLNKRRNPHKKLEWNLHLVKKVIKNLMELTLSKDVHQLKDLTIPIVVWKKLSEKLKIDHKDLKHFWQGKLHMQLFCSEPLYMNDVKIKLIEYFYATGVSKIWEIEWPNVAKHFDGMTPKFLSRIFGHLVHDRRYKGMEFSEIIEHLHEVKKPELQKAGKDKCLPRVLFKDGNVKLLDVEARNRSKRRTVKSGDLSD